MHPVFGPSFGRDDVDYEIVGALTEIMKKIVIKDKKTIDQK